MRQASRSPFLAIDRSDAVCLGRFPRPTLKYEPAGLGITLAGDNYLKTKGIGKVTDR
jgi:hypothetical protein